MSTAAVASIIVASSAARSRVCGDTPARLYKRMLRHGLWTASEKSRCARDCQLAAKIFPDGGSQPSVKRKLKARQGGDSLLFHLASAKHMQREFGSGERAVQFTEGQMRTSVIANVPQSVTHWFKKS